MGIVLGSLIRAVFQSDKKRKQLPKSGQEEEYSREHIRQASRIIKQVVKEPDELPIRENTPAIRELFENGTYPP